MLKGHEGTYSSSPESKGVDKNVDNDFEETQIIVIPPILLFVPLQGCK